MGTIVIVFCPHFWRRRWWRATFCEECEHVWNLVQVIRMRRDSGEAETELMEEVKSGHIGHTLREAITNQHPECEECKVILMEWNRRDAPQ